MKIIKRLKSSHWVIILLMIIGSFLAFWLAGFTNEFWKGIINTVASAVMISGVLGIIDKVFMEQDLINFVCDRVQLKKEIDKLGIINITTDVRHDIDYREYIKEASNHIDIIHVYGYTWTKDNIEYILDNISKKETKVRVLLVDPASDLVNILALQYEKSVEEVRKKISDTFEFWKDKCRERDNNFKFKGNIEIYYTKGNLNTAFYRMDDFLVAVHINSNHSSKSNVISGIKMKKNNNDFSLYSVYLNEMNELFKESSLQLSLKEI